MKPEMFSITNLSIISLLITFQLLSIFHHIYVLGDGEVTTVTAHDGLTTETQPDGLTAGTQLDGLTTGTQPDGLTAVTEQGAGTDESMRLLPLIHEHSPSKKDCDAAMTDPAVATELTSKPYTVDSDEADANISNSCEDIKQRGLYPENPASDEEKDFPIVFIRVVYRAYHIQELLFNLMYAPQNLYCYALDSKSSPLFHEQMRNLSECFPNVILTENEYEVDGAGHNMTKSYMKCLETVSEKPAWKYAILLQNDDFPIKSNYELVKILDILNGSNAINVGRPYRHRVPQHIDWSYAGLNLFKDSSKNVPDSRLKLAKGSPSVALSRGFVEYVMNELNLTTLINIFDSKPFGTDEMIFQSLHSDDALDAPGGFTRKCIDEQSDFTTRYVSWSWSNRTCESGNYRHSACVFGVADLNHLENIQHLFANKMLSENDYGAIACWAMRFSKRIASKSTVDFESYKQSQIVRFNHDKEMWRKNISMFEC
ncbi:Core-2/I-Branching enzyme family protein [Brugia pahangi]